MDSNIVLSTAGSAIGVTYIIELLKKSDKFTWITDQSGRINTIVGIVSAGLVSVGIHYEWDEATRVLALTIPTTAQFLHIMWNWFLQWAIQQYAYKTGVAVKAQ